MCSKILICEASSDKEESHLKKLKTAIDKNESISERLQNKRAVRTHDYINLLLYSITNGRMRSAESIFDYINNKNLTSDFLRVCSTYFKNNKYRGDAYRIIAFVEEKNIFKDLLKVHLNDKIAEELSRKDEETNKCLYSNKAIFSTLHQKQKINKIKSVNCTIMQISLMVFLACIVTVSFVSLSSSDSMSTYSKLFNQPIIKFSLYATLGFLCVGIIASGIIYCIKSMLQSVEQVQKKLGAEQHLKDTNSDKELEMNSSTILKILEPDTSFSDSDTGCLEMSDSERCLFASCLLL
ncbi:hypothetical protein [Wolbachia endosymbiont (group E) of Neria commutata]|uniref:hypothetical protein n=1 Tax=Wolbachia endosymbiont (group E) of Neria commutata TaxID=3066149 RepID=UPI00313346E7